MLFDDYNFKLADRPKSNDMPTSKCDWTLLIKTRQEDNNKQHTTKFSMTRTYVLTRCDKVVITPHCIALSVYPIQVSCILDKLPKTQQLTFPLKSIKRTIFMSRSYIVCSETGEGGSRGRVHRDAINICCYIEWQTDEHSEQCRLCILDYIGVPVHM